LNAKIETAKIGRPQDLDILLDDSNNLVVGKVLENGRFKDINNYFNKSILIRRNFDVNIIRTGINKFLDEYIHYTGEQILMEIAEIGRKKDLNVLIKSKSERIRSIVASHGYDEHLDMLVNDESKMVLQSVLDIGRDKDIDILRKSTYAKELNFPKK